MGPFQRKRRPNKLISDDDGVTVSKRIATRNKCSWVRSNESDGRVSLPLRRRVCLWTPCLTRGYRSQISSLLSRVNGALLLL